MTAFTSIMAGLSALSGAVGVADAREAKDDQKERNQAQLTKANQLSALEAQARGVDAEVVLGAVNPSDSLLAAEDLLKKKPAAKSKRPGGLAASSATNIGGL